MKYKIGDSVIISQFPEFGKGIIKNIRSTDWILVEFENLTGKGDGEGVTGKKGYCFSCGEENLEFAESKSKSKPKPKFKFKVGDKVKVVLQKNKNVLSELASPEFIGQIGTIEESFGSDPNFPGCYHVTFKSNQSQYIFYKELELVEENSKEDHYKIYLGKHDSIEVFSKQGTLLAELYFYDNKLTIQTITPKEK